MKVVTLITLLVLSFCAHGQKDYRVGEKIEVYDPIEKNWFKSTILKIDNSKYFIHYEGYDAKWDTWVDQSRMRLIGEKKDVPFFYLIGTSEKLYTYYVKDKITVNSLASDNINFTSGADTYSFGKLSGTNFLVGNKIYEDNLYALMLDENSFLLTRGYNSSSYYHRDKAKGTEIMNSKQINPALDSMLSQIKRLEVNQYQERTKVEKETKLNTFSNFVSAYSSMRNDPQLEKAVTSWWNGVGKVVNPLVKIYFCSPDFEIVRNEFGIVLRKQIAVLMVYKKGDDGKCYIRVNNMGYESFGGGAFDSQLKGWNSTFSIGKETLYSNKDYEVNCSAVGLK